MRAYVDPACPLRVRYVALRSTPIMPCVSLRNTGHSETAHHAGFILSQSSMKKTRRILSDPRPFTFTKYKYFLLFSTGRIFCQSNQATRLNTSRDAVVHRKRNECAMNLLISSRTYQKAVYRENPVWRRVCSDPETTGAILSGDY